MPKWIFQKTSGDQEGVSKVISIVSRLDLTDIYYYLLKHLGKHTKRKRHRSSKKYLIIQLSFEPSYLEHKFFKNFSFY